MHFIIFDLNMQNIPDSILGDVNNHKCCKLGEPALFFAEVGDDGDIHQFAFIGFETVKDIDDINKRGEAINNRNKSKDCQKNGFDDTQGEGWYAVEFHKGAVFLVIGKQDNCRDNRG